MPYTKKKIPITGSDGEVCYRCQVCGEVKPESQFLNKQTALRCKACRNAYSRQWARAHPEKTKATRERLRDYHKEYSRVWHRNRGWQKRHGIEFSVARYEQMLADQDGKCAICKDVMARPCIDHCHKTNRVRGLLCHSCNAGIGALRDDPEIMGRAIEYVKRAGCVQLAS